MAALDGAVALEQMNEVAVPVAQQLHLDMPRAPDQLLEIHLVLAEGGLGLAPRRVHGVQKLLLAVQIGRMPRPPPPQEALSITG